MEIKSHRERFIATGVPGATEPTWEIRKQSTNQVLGYYRRGLFEGRIAAYTPLELVEISDLLITVSKAELKTEI